MPYISDVNSDDDSHEGPNHPEINSLSESFKPLTGDVRELRIAFEQFRRDIAMGFVPRDILDQRVSAIQNQMIILDQNFNELGKNIQLQEKRTIGNVERLWLRAGSSVGVIGVIIAVAEMFFKH